MNKYRIMYKCGNGYEDEIYVYAVNRTMAFEIFKSFGFEDVVNVDCFRVDNDE